MEKIALPIWKFKITYVVCKKNKTKKQTHKIKIRNYKTEKLKYHI